MEHSDEKQGGSAGQGKSHFSRTGQRFRPPGHYVIVMGAGKTLPNTEATHITKEMWEAIQERSVERDRRSMFAFLVENFNVTASDEQITKLVDFCKGKRVRVGDLILPTLGSIVPSENPQSGEWVNKFVNEAGEELNESTSKFLLGNWKEDKINPDTEPGIHKRK